MVESSEPPGKYIVDRLPAVTVQIRQFIERAIKLGTGEQVLDVIQHIVQNLETRPLEWGDPEYATKHGGGLVLHGIQFPFIVRYVTFQRERVVCILKLKVFPRHPLDSE